MSAPFIAGRIGPCRPWLVAGVLALALALVQGPLAGTAHAFSVTVPASGSQNVVKWFTNSITYFLNVDGCKNLSQAQTFQQWNAGFAGWMAVPCTAVQFTQGAFCNTGSGKCVYDKTTSCGQDADCPAAHNLKMVSVGYNENGRNELGFVNNADWTYGDFVLGVTVPVFDNTGQIYESDIAFNGYQQTWTVNANQISQTKQHLLSVAIHEEGHFFGAQHVLGNVSQNDPPTMAPYVDPNGATATLNADDDKIPCFLYPKATYVCQGDADCPYILESSSSGEQYTGKMQCTQGQCTFGGTVPVGGQGAIGAGCSQNSDCKSQMCQPYGNSSVCSQVCTVASPNCPSGFQCLPYSDNSGQGACIAGQTQATPTKNVGDACGTSSECKSLMCLSGTCKVKCNPNNPIQCDAATQQCVLVPGTGSGACVDNTVQKLPNDANCAANGDCQSGLCMKQAGAQVGQCKQKCTSSSQCANGLSCVAQAGGYSACLPSAAKSATGSACTDGTECTKALCLGDGSQNFCSDYCTVGSASTCPCGMVCSDVGGVGQVCIPGKKVQCVASGGSCSDSSECVAGTGCASGLCNTACTVGDPANPCGPGQTCLRASQDSVAGACGKAGKSSLGTGCAADADCKSGFCHSSGVMAVCTSPCQTDDQCGTDRICQDLGNGLRGCVVGTGSGGGNDAGSDSSGGPSDAGGVTGVDSNGYVPVVAGGGGTSSSSSGCNAGRSLGWCPTSQIIGFMAFLAIFLARRQRRRAA